jgi:hypothetical protein
MHILVSFFRYQLVELAWLAQKFSAFVCENLLDLF